MDLFKFDSSKALFVGVEREAFLVDDNGIIKPKASAVIDDAQGDARFGYELSACQIESRIGPCDLSQLPGKLKEVEDALVGYLATASSCLSIIPGLADWCHDRPEDYCHPPYENNLHTSYVEVGPPDMPLDIYPDPSGRYQSISAKMPPEVILAALRVIGTHIHIGVPDHETALKVYNQVIKKCDWLCARGNGSFGERLDIYRVVAPDCDPHPYSDWTDFYRVALAKGFDQDPRKCWTLIRISKHGTIEFRMFGATASLERIVSWAKLCHDLCKEAMA